MPHLQFEKSLYALVSLIVLLMLLIGWGSVVAGTDSRTGAHPLSEISLEQSARASDREARVEALIVSCNLYPIALSETSLAGAKVGDTIDVLSGTQAGNFGWLSWTGNPSVPTLVKSLTPPGNSNTYINPLDPSDHIVSVGKWIRGKSGASNSSTLRSALDRLKGMTLIVPVWDAVAWHGNTRQFWVARFAKVQLLSYHLTSQDRLSVRFLGYAVCGEVTPTPTSTSTPSPTPTYTSTPSPTPTSTWTSSPTLNNRPTPSSTSYRVADLGVSVDDSADPVKPGQTFQYLVHAYNSGPALANGAGVDGTLSPEGKVQFTGAYNVQYNFLPWFCRVEASEFRCFTSTLQGGVIITLDAIVAPSAIEGPVSLCAGISASFSPGSGNDPNPSNNHDCENTSITGPTLTPTPSPTDTLPDLVVDSMRIELETGGACNYTSTGLGVRVKFSNLGGAAGPFVVDVNGAQQTVTSGLAAGQTSSLWFPGYKSFQNNTATVDALMQVQESNETNNTLSQMVAVPTLPATCTPPPTRTPTLTALAAPDLVVNSMAIGPENRNGCDWSRLGVRVWFRNVGNANAGPFVVEVNGGQQTVESGLAAGQSSSLWFYAYRGAENNTATVDAHFQVQESNEGNNTLSARLPVPAPPPPCTPTSTSPPTPTRTGTPTR